MPRWVAFVAFAALLTVVLLVLARQSQRLVHDVSSGRRTATTTRLGEPLGSDIERQQRNSPFRVAGDELGEPRPTAGNTSAGVELTGDVVLANVIVTQGLVGVLVLAAVWYFSIPTWAIGLEPVGPAAIAIGLGIGLALWVGNELSALLAHAVGTTYDETVRALLAPDSTRGWVLLFGVALPVIAIGEELLFRAALVGVPAGGFGIPAWVLVVVSSVAFALGHGAQGRAGILVTGALGLVLATSYVLTGSLLVVVVAHYVVNALEFLVHEYAGIETQSVLEELLADQFHAGD